MKRPPCERMIIHRIPASSLPMSEHTIVQAEAVPWCKTHQQEMLTGFRCATGFDEEIADLRTEITEIKLRMNRAHR
jgi:hypothetical protein